MAGTEFAGSEQYGALFGESQSEVDSEVGFADAWYPAHHHQLVAQPTPDCCIEGAYACGVVGAGVGKETVEVFEVLIARRVGDAVAAYRLISARGHCGTSPLPWVSCRLLVWRSAVLAFAWLPSLACAAR